MEKRYFTPLEMLKIATQHAYSADRLLHMARDVQTETHDVLLPALSLIYDAFQLTLKAYLAHTHRPVKQHKTLSELLEMNPEFAFSSQERELLKVMIRQMSFNKGIDHELWETRQEQHVFCVDILNLYERLQSMMPLELQADYYSVV